MRRRQSAQVIVWVAIALPVLFLPLMGLAIDSGQVFDARRSLVDLADGAARAGAMEIDETKVRTGDSQIVLNVGNAQDEVRTYLAQADPKKTATLEPNPPIVTETQVTVTLRRNVPTAFLRIVGIRSVNITATGQAQPCSGIDQGVCPG